MQSICTTAIFSSFVVNAQLLSRDEFAKMIGVAGGPCDVEVEDYLMGLACVPSDLARLCVVAVTQASDNRFYFKKEIAIYKVSNKLVENIENRIPNPFFSKGKRYALISVSLTICTIPGSVPHRSPGAVFCFRCVQRVPPAEPQERQSEEEVRLDQV
jgi:hypothetical protein